MIDSLHPLVSAIITTHNRVDLLKRAISHVLDQTYSNIELIVVDDASTDDTQEYCEAQEFKYIRIDKSESKGGNHARNLGIENSHGEYIAFCDDDDYWLPTKIEKQLQLIQKTDCKFVYSGRTAEIYNKDKTTLRDLIPDGNYKGDISRKILWEIPFITATLFVERKLLVEIGGFDESLRAWQEYELSIRLAQHSPTDYISEPLAVYRVDVKDPNRLTNKYFIWRKSVNNILIKHKELYNKLRFKEKIKVKSLIASDAIGRTYASGLIFRWYYNRLLVKIYSFLS